MAKPRQSEADFLAQLSASANAGGGAPGTVEPTKAADPSSNAGMVLHRPPQVKNRKTAAELAASTEEREKQITGANKRADAAIAALPTTSIGPVELHLIDDSPWQPRLTYDVESIDELANSMDAGGQAELITLRRKGERYELLGGHRRVRAARSKGWSTLEAVVKVCDDRTAQKIAMVQNGAREDLWPWEKALALHQAISSGLASNQTEAGTLLGIKQNSVSDLLKMMQLPEELRPLMNAKPGKLGPTHAKEYLELLAAYPDEKELLLEGLNRVLESTKVTPFRGWVLQMISSRKSQKRRATKPHVIANEAGDTLFSAKYDKNRDLIVKNLAQDDFSDEEVVKTILSALRELKERKTKVQRS